MPVERQHAALEQLDEPLDRQVVRRSRRRDSRRRSDHRAGSYRVDAVDRDGHAAEPAGSIRTLSARMSLRTAVAHRNLLYLLSLRELRTRYKKSVLGWAWSLLNPLTQMVIFSVIFLYVFKQMPPIGDPSGLQELPALLPLRAAAVQLLLDLGRRRRSGRCRTAPG